MLKNRRSPILLLLLWLLVPLAGLSGFAYGMFSYFSLENEKERMLQEVSVLASRLNDKPIGDVAATDIWEAVLSQGMLIRWTDPSGKVVSELGSNAKLASTPPTYRKLQHPVIIRQQSDQINVMAPVFVHQIQSGVVELAKTLDHAAVQKKQLAAGLAGICMLSLGLTGILSYIYTLMRKETNVERQKRYLHDLSHELRTPLTVIESYADMMRRWAGSDPKLRNEATDVILSEAKRLRRLTAQMLEQSDWEQLDSLPQSVTFDLLEQLRDIASRLSATFDRTIKVELEAAQHHLAGDSSPPGSEGTPSLRIVGDREQLRQLWIILLDNALKYSKDDISIKLSERAEEVLVTVRDQGIGIPSEDMPHLFNRHYRGKGVKKRRSGAGLGLAIARDIVKRHGGSIHLDSVLEHGTEALVVLPKR